MAINRSSEFCFKAFKIQLKAGHVPGDTWDRANFSSTDIIRTNLVEDHWVMLHTKYQGSRPYGFRQEDLSIFPQYKPMKNI